MALLLLAHHQGAAAQQPPLYKRVRQRVLTSRVRQLDFCGAAGWTTACSMHPRRLFCERKFQPLRDAIVAYCARHAAALAEVARDPQRAASYQYVLGSYDHGGGLGNRLPGMISGLFLAMMTGAGVALCAAGALRGAPAVAAGPHRLRAPNVRQSPC